MMKGGLLVLLIAASAKAQDTCTPPPSVPVNPWDGKNLYEIASDPNIPFPTCGDVGQNESFQGADLINKYGECKRVNICHGNAGFGWNKITVDRDAIGIDNNGNGGHAKYEHNYATNKRPDYFPNSISIPNPNGAGANGYLDDQCNFIPEGSCEPVESVDCPNVNPAPLVPVNPWDGKNLYEIESDPNIPYPVCGDVGQNESFQGAPLMNDAGECKRVNICHGNAGFGWNRITVDRDAIGEGNNGNNGHANYEHNYATNKRPDYFPGTISVPNPNGAGANGYLDDQCNFIPEGPDGTCNVTIAQVCPNDNSVPAAAPPTTTSSELVPDAPWMGKNLYEIESDPNLDFPFCGDIGQNEAFQGAPLMNDAGECKRVNICHGNAGFGWNRITVDRDAIGVDNNGNNGHANYEHNYATNKRPDFFPGSVSVPNPNGAGKNGYLDGQCNFHEVVEVNEAEGGMPEDCYAPETTETSPPAPDALTTADLTTEQAFTKGDPHFKTFGGELYDYHGECDLVLVHNPDFMNGLGMDVHIRTKIQDFWSSVEAAAIKIGDDVIEIDGSGGTEWFWVNGVANEPLKEKRWYQFQWAGFMVQAKQNNYVREINIYIGNTIKERIVLKTFHDFVRVDINWKESDKYDTALGLLGSRELNGARVGRDGKTVIENVNHFGQEWQVREDEEKLFHTYEGKVQAPNQCVLPVMTKEKERLRKRRLAESDLTIEKAEKACAGAGGPAEVKACVYDVIATQDIDMASAW